MLAVINCHQSVAHSFLYPSDIHEVCRQALNLDVASNRHSMDSNSDLNVISGGNDISNASDSAVADNSALDSISVVQIRESRGKRVVPCEYGILIKALWGTVLYQRQFAPGALFQEVYDWLGSMEQLPLFFSLHRPLGGAAIQHQEVVVQSEKVFVHELTSREARETFNESVSLFGNFQFETEGNKTLPDEQEAGTEETKKEETNPGGAEKCRKRGKGSKNKKNKRDKKNKKPRLTEDNE